MFGVILRGGQKFTVQTIRSCGLPCEFITNLTPNQCIAFAFSSNGDWGWERGATGDRDEMSLRATALDRCNLEAGFQCNRFGFICNG